MTGSADAYRAMRLAHVHLNVLGWVGLAVVGTQFTLWPTVLRTRMVADPRRAVGWSLPLMAGVLAVTATGLLVQRRAVAVAGLAGYAAGLGVALVPFVRTALRRRPHTAASWMLGAGVAWFAVAVAADLVAGRAGPWRLRAAGGGAGLAGGRGHPARRSGRVRPPQVLATSAAPAPSRHAVYTSPARATSLSSISPMA